ncbi:baseplate J/gp47 family protein [Paracoccaceae bacterium GXU_MW_L88]
MSGYSAIDLSKLPAPKMIEELNFEAILAAKRARLVELAPHLAAALDYESDDLNLFLQAEAYRELLLRQKINDQSKANMLAFATGSDLDHLAALYGVERALITPADDLARPPVAAVYEGDSRFRRRAQLALEGFSTAGPRGAYVFWAFTADPAVKDVAVSRPVPGTVLVTILSNEGDGSASADLQQSVQDVLSDDDVRPLCSTVLVESAAILLFRVEAELTTYQGPDASVVEEAASVALDQYLNETHRLGHDITLSGIYAALHRPGVQKVRLVEPTADIEVNGNQAAFCTETAISLGGTDV